MQQLKNLADERLLLGCVYCGANDGTREHVPSRVFLDSPYPENLAVVGACRPCNNGFSQDEEYVACFIEAVVCGTADPAAMQRQTISRILERSPALRQRLHAAKTESASGTAFSVETKRLLRVVVKLAVGHAAYDLSQECRQEPESVCLHPLLNLTAEQRDEFEAPEVVMLYGEVGSRGMQRLMVVELDLKAQSGETQRQQVVLNDWVVVQEGRYRYLASDDGGQVRVRIVFSEYMAAEVVWKT